jgi:membrane fusion protein (multidrug efflux system)
MRKVPHFKARIWVLLSAVVILLIASGLWWAKILPPGASRAQTAAGDTTLSIAEAEKSEAEQEPQDVPVPVELARAEQRAIAAFYRAASVIEADRLVELVAKVSGRVQRLDVEEGEWIESGQVLAELDNGRERIQLRQAELRLAEQERLLQRAESMRAEGLISHQEFDEVQSSHDLAETDRDLARIALEETILRAPFAGQITERKIVLGQQVNIAQPLLTLADFEPLRVVVHLPEAIARKITAGQQVLVFPEAAPEALPAVVERLAPVVDPVTSTVRITLLLHAEQQQAKVGGFVKVRITTDSHLDALAIPKLALVEEGGMRSVFVAEADTVRKAEIRTGLYDETHIEVLDGIDADAFVVSLGQGGLRTGSRVEVLNAVAVGWTGPVAGKDLAIASEKDPQATQPQD